MWVSLISMNRLENALSPLFLDCGRLTTFCHMWNGSRFIQSLVSIRSLEPPKAQKSQKRLQSNRSILQEHSCCSDFLIQCHTPMSSIDDNQNTNETFWVSNEIESDGGIPWPTITNSADRLTKTAYGSFKGK